MFAAINGHAEAHTPKEGAKLSESEAQELFDWIDTPDLIPDPKPLPRLVWDGERLRPA